VFTGIIGIYLLVSWNLYLWYSLIAFRTEDFNVVSKSSAVCVCVYVYVCMYVCMYNIEGDQETFTHTGFGINLV
jgi:hypothetical protein